MSSIKATPTDVPEDTAAPAESIHPTFVGLFPDADITLLSKDNFLFPISSETLRRTSGWFRTMFRLPQNAVRPCDNRAEPLSMSECSNVLAGLFSLVSGIALPPLDDIDFVDSLLFAADKYDMPLPIALIRVTIPPLLDASPIRVYGLACRMAWEAEAKAAATRTLAIDIMSPDNISQLGLLEPPHLVKLLLLHDQRRKQAADALEGVGVFSANMRGVRCGGTRPDGSACDELRDTTSWWALKLAWHKEPWRFVALGESNFQTSSVPELDAILDDRCKRCSKAYYSRASTLENLKSIAAALPQTIEV